MSRDDFERQIRRQALRHLPQEWRVEIMTAARTAQDSQTATLNSPPLKWWRELLWPCPQAWAGIAATWIVLLALQFFSRDQERMAVNRPTAPSSESWLVLRRQKQLLAELIGPLPAPVVDRPRSGTPPPRSEHNGGFRIV